MRPQLRQVDPAQVVDAVASVVLLTAALYGFERAYGGTTYLVVGVLGVLVGTLVAFTAETLRAPLVSIAAVAVAAFFLLGGAVAFGGSAALPTRSSLARLTDGAFRGWAQLLTVLPPVGSSGNLMAIPYLLGLLGAVTAFVLARRSRRAWPPLLPAVVVLSLSILFGTDEPASLLVQGVAFGAVGVGWLAMRATRARTVVGTVVGTGRRRTAVAAVALLGVAGAGASVVGPHLPLADANTREVLRDHVDPPFDPRDYASPLADYRTYVLNGAKFLRDKPLFTVQGLPGGTLIRIATMDAYDGTVWNVAGGPQANASDSGVFQRVGETIPTVATGTPFAMRVTIAAYGAAPGQVWLPDAGVVTAARFDGPSAETLADTFRYNLASDGAVAGTAPAGASRGLLAGDSYELDGVLPKAAQPAATTDPALAATLKSAAAMQVTLPALGQEVEAVKTRAGELAGTATSPYERARAIADALRTNGFLSDGGTDQAPSLPGHFAARLVQMVDKDQPMVGDAEQFSALMALMARQLDIPARVVLGSRLPAGPAAGAGPVTVQGKDVTAWVEIGLDGVGWVPLFPTPETVRIPQAQPQPKALPIVKEPPRVPQQPRLDLDTAAGGSASPRTPDKAPPPPRAGRPVWVLAAAVGSVPVAAVVVVAGVVLLLKLVRRRRRRRASHPARQIAGAWDELIDHAHDGGLTVPLVATRRERAAFLAGSPGATALAVRADRAIFGPEQITAADVSSYWADVMTARSQLSRSLGLGGRLRAALSISSLRRRP